VSAQTFVNGVVNGALYVMLALGFSLIYNTTRLFNMSHGAILLTGAFGAYAAGHGLGLPLPLSVAFAGVIATLVHIVVAAIIYVPMLEKNAGLWIIGIAGLGVAIITQVVVALIFGTAPISIQEGYIPTVMQLGSLRFSSVDLAILTIGSSFLVGTVVFLKHTMVGIAIRAATSDREMAGVAGIQSRRVTLIVYAMGAFMAGVAGGLLALQAPVLYSMGNVNLLKAIVVSILGIQWGVSGVLLGGLALGIIENITVATTGAEWRDAASLLVLMVYIWITALLARRNKYR